MQRNAGCSAAAAGRACLPASTLCLLPQRPPLPPPHPGAPPRPPAPPSPAHVYEVSEARARIEEAESERLLSGDQITREAVRVAEQDGIVFIDEVRCAVLRCAVLESHRSW
jgi:hypothetical protein